MSAADKATGHAGEQDKSPDELRRDVEETREQLGGYFMVNAKDLDEAIAIAGRIPGARSGTVEIRPVIEVPGLPENSPVATVGERA